MIDSTRVIRPVADAFISGTLEMPEEAARGFTDTALSWSDSPVNAIFIVIFTTLALLTLRDLLDLIPLLLKSMFRWKESVNIDASIQKKSARDGLAWIYTIPIAMVIDRYDLLKIEALEFIPDTFHSLAVLGFLGAWMLFRWICFSAWSTKTKRPETFRTAHSSFLNFWIIAGFFLVFTVTVVSLTNAGNNAGRTVLIYELVVLYALAIMRKWQILASYCNPFVTFLYLCALELIPTGVLVAAIVLL